MTQDALATRAGLWSLASAYFMLATGSLAVIGLVQPMAESWRVTPADVASLVTVFALTLAVSAPLVQILLGHLARRTLIIGGLTLMASGLAVTAAAPDFTWGIVGRVLAGAGAASVGPIASALGADLVSPQRQPQALATVFFGMTFATVAGVPLTTWLGFLFGWQAVFVLLAIAAMACAGAVALLVSNRASGGRIRLRALFGTVSRASVAWAVLTGLLQMAASFASYALVALYLAERYGAGPDSISAALLLFGLASVIGNLAAGRLGGRYSPATLVQASLVGLLVAFLGLWLVPPTVVTGVIVLGFWSVFTMMFHTPQQGRLIGLAPSLRGLLLSLNSSALYVGMSIGAYVAKETYAVAGSPGLPVASIAITLLALTTMWLSRRAERADR